MGLIKAIGEAVTGNLADQWLEVYEPDMNDKVVFSAAVKTRKGQNIKGSDNTVSNGSIIHVYENQFMMLVDGGKIVDYTAEAGYYKVDNSSLPSLFNGQFGDSLKDAINRIKFGGQTPTVQKVYYINLQEIKGIKFGTRNPVNYFDSFYNAELFFCAHGTYSIKITNPIQFYAEVIPKNVNHVNITDINEQYMDEFLAALQSAISQLSVDGIRASQAISKSLQLGKYMQNVLDEDWKQMRGMEIQSVGLGGLSYDEKSRQIVDMRSEVGVFSDPNLAQAYMMKNMATMAEGVKAAGSNEGGAMNGFLGVGLGAGAMGNMMNGFTQMTQNMQQMQQQPMQQQPMQQQPMQPTPVGAAVIAGGVAQAAAPTAEGWACECGTTNTGKFCSNCGKPAPVKEEGWTCECGATNTGKFCSNCGKPAPAKDWTCECGATNTGKFCSNCGKPRA